MQLPRASIGSQDQQANLIGPLHLAAAQALRANADTAMRAIHVGQYALQIRLERPAARSCDLAADTTKIFGLTTFGDLVAKYRLLATNGTLHPHDTTPANEFRTYESDRPV